MESIIDILSQGRDREAQASKIYGFVIGIVTNNQDPDGLCRVKVKFPWLSDEVESWWARCAQPMAGADRGTMLIPEIDDEVLIGFEHGDVRFPYVVGALHNGVDKPPKANDITSAFGGTATRTRGRCSKTAWPTPRRRLPAGLCGSSPLAGAWLGPRRREVLRSAP